MSALVRAKSFDLARQLLFYYGGVARALGACELAEDPIEPADP